MIITKENKIDNDEICKQRDGIISAKKYEVPNIYISVSVDLHNGANWVKHKENNPKKNII